MSTYRAPVEAGQVQPIAGMSRQMKLSELLKAATGGLTNDVGTFTSDGQNFVTNYGAMIKPITDTATAYFAGQEQDAADASMQQAFQEYADVGRGDFAQGMGPLADRSNVVATPQWKMDAARDKLMVNPDIMANETYAPIILKAALERDPSKQFAFQQGVGGTVFDSRSGTFKEDPTATQRINTLLGTKQDNAEALVDRRQNNKYDTLDYQQQLKAEMFDIINDVKMKAADRREAIQLRTDALKFNSGIAKEAYLSGRGGKPTIDVNEGSGSGSGSGTLTEQEKRNLVHTESGGNSKAVSSAGARGIVQILPSTAAKPGYGMKPIDLNTSTDAEQIAFADNYIGNMMKAHGWTKEQAISAYHMGPGNVQANKGAITDPRYVNSVTGNNSLAANERPSTTATLNVANDREYPQIQTELEDKKALQQNKQTVADATAAAKLQKGREFADTTINRLRGLENSLIESGGAVSSKNEGLGGTLNNIVNSLEIKNPLGIPNWVGSVTNDKNTATRQELDSSYKMLLRDITQAAGISASMMNSDRELQAVEKLVNNPSATSEAKLQALGSLQNRFGTGVPKVNETDAQRLKRLVGEFDAK